MANVKISQLPGATTPLGGSEEIPLVQGTTTKKVTVGGLFTSPVLTTPNLGTPSAVNLTNATNVPVNQATGVLPVANGGTNATTASTARANLGAAASGANADITSLTGVTGGISTADFVQFDTGITPTTAVGKLQWDPTWGGPQVGMTGGNVNLQIGQEDLVYVYNNTGSQINEGQVVRVLGSQGQRLTVALAQANNDAGSTTVLGMATENIANGASGFITTQGLVSGINTTGFADGDVVWLSPTTPGGVTIVKPTAPDHLVLVGYVVKGGSAGAGSIFIHTQNGYELDELHDVKITSVANNQLLQYDISGPYWKNVSTLSGSLITGNISGNAANVTGTVAIANGGTGQTTANAALNALLPSQTGNNGKVLSTNGTNTSWVTSNSGTVTSVDVSGGTTGLTTSGGPVTTSGTVTLAGTLNVANGGTGATTLTGYVKGNGTSAMTASSTVPTSDLTGTLAVANGGTGQTSYTDGQLLIGNSATGGLTKATLVQGTNVSIVNGNGTITISATGGTGGGDVSGPASATNNAVALFDGTTGKLIKDSAQTIATANTASTVVARDASGNFSAGTITAALSGNATTATTLQTARNINGTSFNGSADITITANTPNALTAGSYLTSGGTFNGSAARTFAVDATDANTASKVVARDASGNFSAGTITANLSGNATTATTANAVANALTAGSYLTSGGTFNGSAARTFAVDATDANTASKVVARDASGNFSAGTITATGLSDSGNLTFTGTGNRITGDFSNATVGNNVLFQSSTANGATTIYAIPNGTASASAFTSTNSSDTVNYSRLSMSAQSADVRFVSSFAGTGTYLPMTFYTGGSERVRIDTSGNVGIGTSSPSYRLHAKRDAAADVCYVASHNDNSTVGSSAGFIAIANGAGNYSLFQQYASGATFLTGNGANVFVIGTGAAQPLLFQTNNAERARIDSSGNVLVTGSGGLGYGTGSGGAVTQATSRTTGVTLDKTNGAITLVSAAGTTTWQTFTVTNNTVAATDTIVVNQKSGTDLYEIHVTNVAAGSFKLSYRTTGGTTTEQPVFNFAVIKAVTA